MNPLIETIIMLLILGVLVSIHEAGHLATAKIFKVYCFEYSIGMGPALLHKKKKGGETYFSLRAIPFGGYVSMYGESEQIQLEEGQTLPPEDRSLENIKKWKKIIILFAGVFLNFLLGLLLIFISVSCFPQYSYGNGYRVGDVQQDTIVFVPVEQNTSSFTYSQIQTQKEGNIEIGEYDLFLGFPTYQVGENTISTPRIVSTDVTIQGVTGDPFQAVAVYTPSKLTTPHSLLDDLYFFEPLRDGENNTGNIVTLGEKYTKVGINKLPYINDALNNYYDFSSGNDFTIEMTLNFAPVDEKNLDETKSLSDYFISVHYTNIVINSSSRTGLDLDLSPIKYYNDFKDAVDEWEYYVPYCCTAIAKGLVSLFSIKGIGQLSGIVGMTAMVGTYSAMGGASMIFLFAGLISINLAFFNLIPFPGLDGYQILVTAIEGVSKKKVPAKVKNIVSAIGLVLLFGLMIVITIKDIIGLF